MSVPEGHVQGLREKWRAMLTTDVARQKFDKAVDLFLSLPTRETLAVYGPVAKGLLGMGPTSPGVAAFWNFVIDWAEALEGRQGE